ncbi:hypothetical protein [Pseudobdellovibrio exovorus]|uniref:Outer membrane protein beta-barrel domain-containing protein n=1 Tax=Pseudobdellovibrio exovorus JSS TaxID=1184267 RepID=M4VA03_9BACT|nr:hypothetical protein [Pseudobdellovibrio exovorus]AGH96023.1 hypothetical protein A11Q_1807 [Pseudobdellovibrio exovorus JSS]
MKKNLWISVPLLSLICVGAHAAGTPTVRMVRPAQAAAPTAPQSTVAAPQAQAAAPSAPAAKTATAAPTSSASVAKPAAAAQKAATSTTKAPAAKAEEKPSVSFGLMFDTNYTLQAKQQDDGSRSQEQDFTLMPSMKYSDYSANVSFTYVQDLADSKNSAGFIDPAFGFSRKAWKLNDYFNLGPSMSLILPMTDNSKNNVGLMYNIGAALSLSVNTKTLGWDNWRLSTSVSYNRNFTDYDTRLDGNPNTAYRIRQRYNIGYNFTDQLSLSTRFQFDSNYSVSGIVRNSFLHFQSLGYDINDVVGVNFTHTNSNSMYKAQTYESNLKFFDDTSSTYSVGLTLSI